MLGRLMDFKLTSRIRFVMEGGSGSMANKERISKECVGNQNDDPDARLNT